MAPNRRLRHSFLIRSLGLVALSSTLYCCASEGANAGSTKPKVTTPTSVASDSAKPKPKPPPGIGPYRFVRPKTVKGIYLTAWSAGSRKKMDKVLDMIDRTELNAVVIDVRDQGEMYFRTGIELADKSKATTPAVRKPEELMARLRKRGVWPIARIAVFRDNFVPSKFKKLAVQRADGTVWRDRAGNSWLDPYNRENWEYMARTVRYALDLGFPEIQLDYVRFPSEGRRESMVFPAKPNYPDRKAKPEDVIAAFAEYIGGFVRQSDAEYSADIFGIISSSTSKDQGIGQTLEKIAAPFDVISPMVYPSHFADGEYGIKNPNRQPYAIVKRSLADFKERVPKAKVRPWLQSFSMNGVTYGQKEVRAQIQAAKEVGYTEFLLWNASNRYIEASLERAKPAAKVGVVADAPDQAIPDR